MHKIQAFLCDLASDRLFALLSFLSPLIPLAPVIMVFLLFLHHLDLVCVSKKNVMCCSFCPMCSSPEIIIAFSLRSNTLSHRFLLWLPTCLLKGLPILHIHICFTLFHTTFITTWHYFTYSSVYCPPYHSSVILMKVRTVPSLLCPAPNMSRKESWLSRYLIHVLIVHFDKLYNRSL